MKDLRIAVDVFQAAQKMRVAMGNRISAVERGADDARLDWLTKYHERFQAVEDEAALDMEDALQFHVMTDWLVSIKGINSKLAGQLLGLLPEIEGFTTVSKLWRFAGMAVIEGEAERPRKGEKRHYSTRVKVTVCKIGDSFMRCDSPYRAVYDEKRAYYDARRPTWSKLRRHYAARRVMVKVFLCHLWVEWRTRLGLPVRAPYSGEYLEHDITYPVEQFVPQPA